jgi:hypothetical protein
MLQNYNISKKEIRKNYFNGKIEFRKNSKFLIKSFINSNLIGNAITNDKYTHISFNCSSIELLQNCYHILNSINILKMIYDLSRQMKYLLENYKYVFVGFNLKHVLVVNGNTFMYIYGSHLEKIDHLDKIEINFPPHLENIILAPELFEIKELPCRVNYKCSFFSVGIMYLQAFKICELNNFTKIDTNDKEEIEQLLNNLSFTNSKLFFFFQRCLYINPVKRSILFI